MEENYRWISAVVVDSGERVAVRQCCSNSSVWIDKNGKEYDCTELDFTQAPKLPNFITDIKERMKQQNEDAHERTQKELHDMLAALDTKKIADHQADIDERAYWRNLRRDIFMKILERGVEFKRQDHLEWAIEQTERTFNRLYAQHQEFSNKC